MYKDTKTKTKKHFYIKLEINYFWELYIWNMSLMPGKILWFIEEFAFWLLTTKCNMGKKIGKVTFLSNKYLFGIFAVNIDLIVTMQVFI